MLWWAIRSASVPWLEFAATYGCDNDDGSGEHSDDDNDGIVTTATTTPIANELLVVGGGYDADVDSADMFTSMWFAADSMNGRKSDT